MNTQEDKVYNYINEHTMIQANDRIVVGLSGGADSVSLLLMLAALCTQLGIKASDLVAVHVHHGLRGEEALRDAEFAKALCARMHITYVMYQADVKALARQNRQTIEEAGRTFRYECFAKTCEQYKCNKIAVAHNKNDLAETVLFHLARGSGMNGMRGILPVRDNIIRPLLCLTREEIISYLMSKNESFCEDSTNAGTDYDRNRIRHEIIPLLQTLNSRAVEHICRFAGEADAYYTWGRQHTEEQYGRAVSFDGSRLLISVDVINNLAPLLRRNICYQAIVTLADAGKDITASHVKSLLGLFDAQSGKEVVLPYGICARRSYDTVLLTNTTKEKTDKDTKIYEIVPPNVYAVGDRGTLIASIVPYEDITEISKNKYTKMLDYGKINGTLCLRTPKPTDYLSIDETGNTKKLSRLFIDAKTDREKRTDWPVVACGGEVVWAIGIRDSYKYRIDSQTRDVLVLQYVEKGDCNGRED